MKISEGVQELNDQAIKVRRDLHKIPESGFNEIQTSEYICNYLNNENISFVRMGKTAVIAEINRNMPYTIALRADMDALSLSEQTGVDFASEYEGMMHGCGHDGHMTMLLLVTKLIKKNEEQLKCNVVFIFQPAEEGPGGAEVLIKEGLMTKFNIDEVFGYHLHPEFEEGTIAINHGPVMAMTGEFDLEVIGKSGHGAMPHTAQDAIVIASHLVTQLQSIASRNINPTEASVVTIGRIDGGERRNIIAEEVVLEGTIRAFDENVYKLIVSRMNAIIKGVEIAFDCTIKCEIRTMYPPVVNHKSSVDLFKSKNEDMTIVEFPPQMISEDFSYYLKEAKGAFVFLGTKNVDKNYIFPLHNARFNFDERVLLVGIQSYMNLLGIERV